MIAQSIGRLIVFTLTLLAMWLTSCAQIPIARTYSLEATTRKGDHVRASVRFEPPTIRATK